jgi:peptidoglycan/LPS O-acetylase OafA/YrhL
MGEEPRNVTSEQAERRHESEEERLDRNLNELLQGLRVALPGLQVLFAFLLVVPFQNGWDDVTEFEQTVYYATLILTAGACICLIAPMARHRMRFRELDKEWIVRSSNRLAIVGIALMGAAICGALLLVSHVVYDGAVVAIVPAAVAALILWTWFGAPLLRELRDHD